MAKQHYIYYDLESMKESTAAAIAEESTIFKGFNVYFIDFKKDAENAESAFHQFGYLGYSILIYKNNRPIKYAWDHQLHHKIFGEYDADHNWKTHEPTDAELKQYYLNHLKGLEPSAYDHAVYVPADMDAPIESYNDFQRRQHWLNNYYPLECDSESLCYIGEPDPEQAANLKRCIHKTREWSLNQYANEADAVLYDEMTKKLYANYESYMNNSLDAFRSAVAYELANHEACYTGEYAEALAALGYRFNSLDEKRQAIVIEELNRQIYRTDI